MTKRGLLFSVLFIFLLMTIFSVNAAIRHSSYEFILNIDGTDRTLQYAIDNDFLIDISVHTYAEPSSISNPGHSADEIWISTDSGEMTLLDALSGGISLKKSSFGGYSSVPSSLVYHYADEIQLSSGKNFQQAINDGDFYGECTPGETRAKDCDYLDTVCRNYHDVTDICDSSGYWTNPPCDSYTNAPKGTTPCDGSDIKACDGSGNCQGWSGYGCGSCPSGYGSYSNACGGSTRYCNLNGNQGRYYTSSNFWSQWSYNPQSAVCQSDCCTFYFLWCWSWAGQDHNWQIKP